MSFSLASSVMLCTVRLTQPKRKMVVDRGSALVQEHFGLTPGHGDFKGDLYPKRFERRILKHHEDAFKVHKSMTCRWEHGFDAIYKKGKPAWDEAMRKFVVAFDDAADRQAEVYEAEILPEAKRNLGSLQADVIYPDAGEWRASWSLKPIVRPVPNTGDLRFALPKEEIEAIEQELREQHRAGLKDVYQRLHGLVESSARTLGRYGVEKGAKLYEQTAQTHLSDLISALDGLNIPDEHGKRDPVLEDLATEITNTILSESFSDLKEDKDLRKDVADKAAALADKIQGYV